MKQIFLSLPMSGRKDEEIWDEIFWMTKYVLDHKDLFGIEQGEKYEVVHGMLTEPELDLFDLVDNVKRKNLLYLGADITKLAQCDAILMSENWVKARGCRIEHSVASEYGIQINFMNTQ